MNFTWRKEYQDEKWIEEEIEADAKATILLELIPEHMCGKFVNES